MTLYKRVLLFLAVVIITITICSYFYIVLVLKPHIDAGLQIMPLTVRQQLASHKGNYVQLDLISKYTSQAAIASQDERFYSNPGVDIKGTIRAILYTLINHRRQGASTITEQLAKNVYFNDQDNLQTDILTKIYALFITQKFTKAQIMELYLNEIYFGHLAYGINSAAQTYFHTSAQNLTILQSAYLLGLINAPSYFAQHPIRAKREAGIVLTEMRSEHDISLYQLSQYQKKLKNITIY